MSPMLRLRSCSSIFAMSSRTASRMSENDVSSSASLRLNVRLLTLSAFATLSAFDGPSPMAVLARHAMEHVPSLQVGQEKRTAVLAFRALEEAHEVAGLLAVEVHGAAAPPPRLRLLLPPLEQEDQRVAQRGRTRGSVMGIGSVSLPLPGDRFGCLPVVAAGGALDARAVDVEPRVPKPSPLEEPHPKTFATYFSQV